MNMDKKNRYMPKQSGRIVECNDLEEQSTYYKRLNCQETTKNFKLIHLPNKKRKKHGVSTNPSPLFSTLMYKSHGFPSQNKDVYRTTSSKNWASCTIAAMVRTSARFRSSSIGTLDSCRFMAISQPSPPGPRVTCPAQK